LQNGSEATSSKNTILFGAGQFQSINFSTYNYESISLAESFSPVLDNVSILSNIPNGNVRYFVRYISTGYDNIAPTNSQSETVFSTYIPKTLSGESTIGKTVIVDGNSENGLVIKDFGTSNSTNYSACIFLKSGAHTVQIGEIIKNINITGNNVIIS
jgi:hypothetical protein